MAVGPPTLGTAEGPFLVFSHCGLYSLPPISSPSILSWGPGGFRWGLLDFPLAGAIYLILHSPTFRSCGLPYLGWHLTEAAGLSVQVAG